MNLINESNLEMESKRLEIQSYLDTEATRLMDENHKEIKDNEDENLLCTHSKGKEFNFYKFANLKIFLETKFLMAKLQ